MLKKLLVVLLCFSVCSGCQKQKLELYKNATLQDSFDTVFTFSAYAHSQEEFDAWFALFKEELTSYHRLYDIYHDYSGLNNLKTINDNAGIQPVVVDRKIIDLLLFAKEWYDKTEGFCDITMGPVLKIWHSYREAGILLNEDGEGGPLPNMEALEEAYQYTGWSHVIIDEAASTVYLDIFEASLDVGAVAKGYAVEQISLKLEEAGVLYGFVNGGGNVRTIHTKADGSSWNVGITVPDNLGANIGVFAFGESMSIATSGDYERYYVDVNGDRQQHIIDPRTLMPVTTCRSVSVITTDAGIADVLSTYFVIAGFDFADSKIQELQSQGIKVDLLWIYDQNVPEHHWDSYQYETFTVLLTADLEAIRKK
ncbi:MAG: FAD:protein FMN transferase [Erysipelotrichaceae bacterium]|jgi:thiamine biosynthesis lipoprotein|nr:FAD:protein FMN transferase [Erysipelotrichaceae bacterium]